jgi:hypothetical protein
MPDRRARSTTGAAAAVVMTPLTQLMESNMLDDLLTTKEMCAYLLEKYQIRIRPGTLRARRCMGLDAPEFIKVGNTVWYRRSAGDAYARRAVSAPMKSTKDEVRPAITAESATA